MVVLCVLLCCIIIILVSRNKKVIGNIFSADNFKVGFGYDVHKLEVGADLVLCGTKINHNKGLVSFSDGDVAVHALIDALLGAAGLDDIGTNFPDDNSDFKNISSLVLLKKTMELINKNDFETVNIDITIVAQKPVLKPFIEKMKETLSVFLNLPKQSIGIKATTEEGLGFTGTEQGIKAFCVALVKKS